MQEIYDAVIIGGGAAGMTAAITLKTQLPTAKILILERLDRVGKKLALTGNGRCNISNRELSVAHYHGSNPEFIKPALVQFGLKSTEAFFEKLGVVFREGENGKLYPYSLQASSVVDALRFALKRLSVETAFESPVEEILTRSDLFELRGAKACKAHTVIVATGGKAGGKLATDSGYQLLASLGHTRTKLSPAIVQVRTDTQVTRQLKGVKVLAEVTANGHKDYGEVLFCDYGLSGPPILQLSRYLKPGDTVYLNLMPEYDCAALKSLLKSRAKDLKDVTAADFFGGLLQKRLGGILLKMCGFPPNDPIKLSDGDLTKIAALLKNLPFTFKDTNGFQSAQVTHGGIKTDEFFENSLMSKKHKGLFACGEVLDIDGDCGGYNLQWAWSSGHLCGVSAAKVLMRSAKQPE